ncbi:MAG: DUF4174 domain-containing protein [Bacteroidota bacterium]
MQAIASRSLQISGLLVLMSFFGKGLQAQELAAHQWENRVLVLLVEDTTAVEYQQQLAALKAEAAGLQERKLLVYQVLPQQYRIGLAAAGAWKPSSSLYERLGSEGGGLEVVLIGLDGGIKLRQPGGLACADLFALIDGMPMRRAEMRRKRN